jgi:NAD(P)-dependent dehydrogenase (short-subunit alcohol dehydrogenase family)
MDLGVKGKVAVITGGNDGIGKAIAKTFAEEGAIVVISGRSRDKIDRAIADIGGVVHGCAADVTTQRGVDSLVAFAGSLGPIEYLVNNVGIFASEDFFEIDDARWQEFFEVNVMSGVRMCRAVLRDMLARDSGSIVFISSDAGIKSIPWMVHYSMTKSAQLGVSRALAEITKGTNVRVNAYLPGPTATDSVKAYMAGIAEQEGKSVDEVIGDYFDRKEPSSLLRRLIDPAWHGRAVLALATNPAMNGTAQRGDGGVVRTAF